MEPQIITPVMGDWQKLIWILKQPFDRNGLFFVGTLTARPPEDVVGALQKAIPREVSIRACRFDPDSELPFQPFEQALQQIRAAHQRTVLVVWCLEHLSEERLKCTLRRFNQARERLSQGKTARGDSIPIVLLMNRTMYDEYFFRWAGDLADCLLAALSLD